MRGMVPVAVFVIMICAVAAEKILMCLAALAAVAIFLLEGGSRLPMCPDWWI